MEGFQSWTEAVYGRGLESDTWGVPEFQQVQSLQP